MPIFGRLLLGVALFFPYYKIHTWKYALATVFILGLMKKYFPQDYKEKLGLNFTRHELWRGGGALLIGALITELFIQFHLGDSGVSKASPEILGLWFFQPLFQSLNEEMVLRALLFSVLFHQYPKTPRWKLSLSMASIFMGLHFLACWALYQTPLHPISGLVIFFATLFMNGIYFRTGHVLYTWAIHFGINFSFFGGAYVRGEVPLNDAEKFNLIYSSPVLFLGILCLFLLVTVLRGKRAPTF